MRPTAHHPIQPSLGRRPVIQIHRWTLLLILLWTLTLGACTNKSAGIYNVPYASGPWSSPQSPPNAKERQLAQAPFSVQLVRYTDTRRPESLAALSPEQRYYDYNSEDLLQSTRLFVPNTLEKYLTYRPKMPNHYHVEFELRHLTTIIKKGTFLSGTWGRYNAHVEALVTIRHPGNSAIIMQRVFNANLHQPRQGHNGRSPLKETDRAELVALTDQALRAIAQNIGTVIYRYNTNLLRPKTPSNQ